MILQLAHMAAQASDRRLQDSQSVDSFGKSNRTDSLRISVEASFSAVLCSNAAERMNLLRPLKRGPARSNGLAAVANFSPFPFTHINLPQFRLWNGSLHMNTLNRKFSSPNSSSSFLVPNDLQYWTHRVCQIMLDYSLPLLTYILDFATSCHHTDHRQVCLHLKSATVGIFRLFYASHDLRHPFL